tara:strand:- start:182 stop:412 length:231 start_codon:yes stop_codon:yes gene_type:complete
MVSNLIAPVAIAVAKAGLKKIKDIASKKITTGQAVTAVTAGAIGGKAGKKIEEKVKSTLKNKKYGETDLLNGDDHP